MIRGGMIVMIRGGMIVMPPRDATGTDIYWFVRLFRFHLVLYPNNGVSE